jgi:hypothetical protein
MFTTITSFRFNTGIEIVRIYDQMIVPSTDSAELHYRLLFSGSMTISGC